MGPSSSSPAGASVGGCARPGSTGRPHEGHRPSARTVGGERKRWQLAHQGTPKFSHGRIGLRPCRRGCCSKLPLMAVRIFHVDDHELIRIGIDAVIEKCPGLQLVGWAATAEEALHRIPVARPDVAILDIQLGEGTNGIELCREIRSRWPDIHCLMFTAYGDDQSVFASIMAGASGYLLKGVGAAKLMDAVRAVAAGRSLLDPGVTAKV